GGLMAVRSAGAQHLVASVVPPILPLEFFHPSSSIDQPLPASEKWMAFCTDCHTQIRHGRACRICGPTRTHNRRLNVLGMDLHLHTLLPIVLVSGINVLKITQATLSDKPPFPPNWPGYRVLQWAPPGVPSQPAGRSSRAQHLAVHGCQE